MISLSETDPSGSDAVRVSGSHRSKSAYRRAKRQFDFLFSALLLILIAPLLLLIAIAIYLEGGAPFFAHERVGRKGRTFRCLKFRTMARDADKLLAELLESSPEARAEWEETRKLTNDPRVTPLGNFLRRSSLDELPQFFNVLIGNMSVVGPRPITAPEMEEYGDAAKTVTSVLPGVTGLWQVSGRNDLTLQERRAMDLEYIEKASLGFDFRIIGKTILAVLKMSGQ